VSPAAAASRQIASASASRPGLLLSHPANACSALEGACPPAEPTPPSGFALQVSAHQSGSSITAESTGGRPTSCARLRRWRPGGTSWPAGRPCGGPAHRDPPRCGLSGRRARAGRLDRRADPGPGGDLGECRVRPTHRLRGLVDGEHPPRVRVGVFASVGRRGVPYVGRGGLRRVGGRVVPVGGVTGWSPRWPREPRPPPPAP
jgi:hypothetical protein